MVRDVAKKAGFLLCAVSLILSTVIAAAEVEVEVEKERVWLGVLMDSESVDGGILLMAVIPGGPAATAGLQGGDVLLAADGRALMSTADLEAVLDLRDPGDRVHLTLLRAGKTEDRQVELDRRPATVWSYVPPVADEAPRTAIRRGLGAWALTRAAAYGFAVTDVTPDLRAFFGAPEEAGVLITEVRPGRSAYRAGLRVGDVLVQIGPVEVKHAVEVDALLPVGSTENEVVEARVVRDNHPTIARLVVPKSRAWFTVPEDVASDEAESEALERALQWEIERLSRRLEELEQRLRRLRESKE